ncbi:MAG: RdgB/HAM1 family non-canonical purine NTP pyrophosphatase [Thermoplasmatota archaeon]
MTRSLPETITFVTSNAGKVAELRAVLDPLGIAVVPDDRGYPEIQHDELAGVAEAGAGYLLATGLEPPFLLEDAGLFVAALKGFPGVYSRHAYDTIGCQGLLDLLRDVELENRSATFRANLCYVDEDGNAHHFDGTCKGRIADRAAGDQGFGFDPIFVPDETPDGAAAGSTFAQLSQEEKNQVSHRGKATEAFTAWLSPSSTQTTSG